MSNSDRPSRYRCRVTGLQDLTHDVRLIRLALESGEPLTFRAGQFVQLGFADLPFTDYSIANRPGEEDLEFFIRESGGDPGGAQGDAQGGAQGDTEREPSVSSYATRSLSLGEMVDLQGPYGDCYLREAHRGPVLALAGGSGLAPIKSIVETLLAGGGAQPIHLYFGVRGKQDLFLSDHFRMLAAEDPRLRFVAAVEQAEEDETEPIVRSGLVTDLVARDFDTLAGFKAYLAGPPPMIEAATEVLLALGLASEDLHADAFHSMDLSTAREAPELP